MVCVLLPGSQKLPWEVLREETKGNAHLSGEAVMAGLMMAREVASRRDVAGERDTRVHSVNRSRYHC